jgi:hypothetical protein
METLGGFSGLCLLLRLLCGHACGELVAEVLSAHLEYHELLAIAPIPGD